jgi:hypothetical protein
MVYGGEYIILAVVVALSVILAAIYWIDRRQEPERDEYDKPPLNLEQRARNASDD